MNPRRVAEKLGISEERLDYRREALVRESGWPSPPLLRFEKSASGIEAGTVIFDNGEIVFGYPKISRALMLRPAIKKRFSGLVAVEEKMNGYNLRVASLDGEVVALTRGGFICPYSTEVAREALPEEIFEDHPGIVLCGEMVGPENPYVPKEIYPVDSVQFYLFDLSMKNQRSIQGIYATHELGEEYGIPCAPLLGEFRADRAYDEVVEIVRSLGKKGREGVILKDPENLAPPLKYTTSESNYSDLAFAFGYYNDLAIDFMVSRAVREGFQSVEWQESDE